MKQEKQLIGWLTWRSGLYVQRISLPGLTHSGLALWLAKTAFHTDYISGSRGRAMVNGGRLAKAFLLDSERVEKVEFRHGTLAYTVHAPDIGNTIPIQAGNTFKVEGPLPPLKHTST